MRLLLGLWMVVAACCQQPGGEIALKDAFRGRFLIGAALNRAQYSEEDARALPLIARHFNTITPENDLKWERINPEPGVYRFDRADRFVAFGEKHDMFIVGHTLVWHSQTPKWVFEESPGVPASRELLLARMRDHIRTVVGRYRGRIHGWDVVNEALNEDGTLRESPWLRIIGEDYLEKAFEFAHESDPAAQLYYNDYSLENEAKRKGAVALIRRLQERGVPVYGVGLQGHNRLAWPTAEEQDATIAAFAALGVKVMITELDLDVLPSPKREESANVSEREGYKEALDPYTGGIPKEVLEHQARRYRELFAVFRKYEDVVDRVTFWGVTDGDSWKNNFPVRGRTNYPLLFDRNGDPKPAFGAVLETAAP